MKKTVLTLFAFLLLAQGAHIIAGSKDAPEKPKKSKIQIALLLDTSSSMNGLIDQARSQLWKLVNKLASAEKNGQMPDIQLALFEYGNSSIPAAENFISMETGLTSDLDLVSEKLFGLTTNGGSEYCGEVIQCAVKHLEWSGNSGDLKLIYIAGNEEFTQGSTDYKKACKTAISKGIIVNTIFCGAHQDGVQTMWKDGADLADGEYMNIDQGQAVVHIDTPWDKEIMELNQELNETYIYYGSQGYSLNTRMMAQDSTSAIYGSGNGVERAVSKSNANYLNTSWDMVDYWQENQKLPEIKKEELPENMKGLSQTEIQQKVEQNFKERKDIRERIATLNQKRNDHIVAERSKMGENQTLDEAVQKSMQRQAAKLNYNFK